MAARRGGGPRRARLSVRAQRRALSAALFRGVLRSRRRATVARWCGSPSTSRRASSTACRAAARAAIVAPRRSSTVGRTTHGAASRRRRHPGARPRWALGSALVLVVVTVGIATRPPSAAPRRRGGPTCSSSRSTACAPTASSRPTPPQRFPALAKLAARGVRFREAHVTVPRTFPSFVTLLTGRYPHHHGIRHMFPSAEQRAAIGPALPTALARRPATARAVISDYAGEIFSRTPMGFDGRRALLRHEDDRRLSAGCRCTPTCCPMPRASSGAGSFPTVNAMPELSDPARLADARWRELDRQRGDQPFFMTVFFSAAHFPYASPDPYYRRYRRAADYDGPYRYQKPPLAPAPATEADRAQIRALYDGAVAATDAAIGRILDAARRRRPGRQHHRRAARRSRREPLRPATSAAWATAIICAAARPITCRGCGSIRRRSAAAARRAGRRARRRLRADAGAARRHHAAAHRRRRPRAALARRAHDARPRRLSGDRAVVRRRTGPASCPTSGCPIRRSPA